MPDLKNTLCETDRNACIPIGVLFSQSGPMSVTELAHLKGTLIAIEEINRSGGVNGMLLQPIIDDPKSDAITARKLAAKLLTQDQVSVIFGCCSSSIRKAVLPIIERYGALLFYPSFYEGFEYSPNIVYTGATPNQTVIPLVEMLFNKYGKRFAMVGSDYIYAHEINRIVKEFLIESGGSVVTELYVQQGAEKEHFKMAAKKLAMLSHDIIFSTVVGADTAKLYDSCYEEGIEAKNCPIASLTTSESELASMDEASRCGHITALSYFQSVTTDENIKFQSLHQSKYGLDDLPCVYSETTYSQVHILSQALSRVSKLAPEALLSAIEGIQFNAPQGRILIDPDNNHTYLTPRIGQSTAEGTFEIVWQAPEPVKPDPYLVAYDRTIATTEMGELGLDF